MAITMKDAGKYPLVLAKVMLSNLCLWPMNKSLICKVLRYIMLGNVFCMLSAHLIYMLKNITDMAAMASTCATVATSIQAFSKIFLINYYSDDLTHLLNIISKEYWPADLAGPETERSILGGSRVIVGMMCIYYSIAFLSCWDFMAIPLVYGRRILPLESSFPFEWDVSPLYEILYVWQFFSNMFIVIHTMASHDFLLNCFMASSISQFKLLQTVLRSIGSGEDKIINGKLKNLPGQSNKNYHLGPDEEEEFELLVKCIEHHNKVIYVCDNLERIYRKMIFLQCFLSAIAICVSTFVLMKYDNYVTKMLSFSMAHLVQFFFLCAIGNELIHQSVSVADAAYDSNWYLKPYPQVRRGLLILIQRAQREKKITAMGFAKLDFLNFINVLRLTFSFYTMLSTLEEKKIKAQYKLSNN